VTGDPRTPSSRRPERELVRTVAGYLAEQGYRVAVDPDGTDYFDLVARRGEEVGLVEVKVGDSKAVLAQALKRRGWGDWSAVALGSVRAAERLSNRTASTRAAPIGVWSVGPEAVRVHRPARRWVRPGEEDPFAPLRARFRRRSRGARARRAPVVREMGRGPGGGPAGLGRPRLRRVATR